MKKRIAFIINPISGTINKQKIPVFISRELDKNIFEPEIVFTRYAGHATKLALEFIERGFDYIVAVGGDGTVNEIAFVLKHTSVALGIVPIGSGNGLARHLGISMNVKKAIRQLNHSEVSEIDYCLLNNKPFFCTSGVGFDAFISQEFDNVKKRGSYTYLKKIFKGFFNYKPQSYTLIVEGEKQETPAFLITFANASQWGNNAHIAPKASLKDGLFDVTVVKSVPFFLALWLSIGLFTKTFGDNKYIKTFRAKSISVVKDEDMPFHLDGEPLGKTSEIHVNIVPGGIKVFCQKDFQ